MPPEVLRELKHEVDDALTTLRHDLTEIHAKVIEDATLPVWGLLDESYVAVYRQAQRDMAALLRKKDRD